MESVDIVYGIWKSFAALAGMHSPYGWANLNMAVGAIPRGNDISWPKIVVFVLILETSLKILGDNFNLLKAYILFRLG